MKFKSVQNKWFGYLQSVGKHFDIGEKRGFLIIGRKNYIRSNIAWTGFERRSGSRKMNSEISIGRNYSENERSGSRMNAKRKNFKKIWFEKMRSFGNFLYLWQKPINHFRDCPEDWRPVSFQRVKKKLNLNLEKKFILS